MCGRAFSGKFCAPGKVFKHDDATLRPLKLGDGERAIVHAHHRLGPIEAHLLSTAQSRPDNDDKRLAATYIQLR